jgi:hypothetical protein
VAVYLDFSIPAAHYAYFCRVEESITQKLDRILQAHIQ